MGDNQGIKIRTLPRGDERRPELSVEPPSPGTGFRLMLLAVAAGAGVMLAGNLFLPQSHSPRSPSSIEKTNTKIDQLITKSMQDAELKHEMLVRKRELENEQIGDTVNKPQVDNRIWDDPAITSADYGVSLNTEDTAARVYADLHDDDSQGPNEMSPADKINAHLANLKWYNEMEKAERIQFVRNFIKSAYDHGYEVQIDQNLKVVGVRRITGTRKVDINKIIDRLARQGL